MQSDSQVHAHNHYSMLAPYHAVSTEFKVMACGIEVSIVCEQKPCHVCLFRCQLTSIDHLSLMEYKTRTEL